MVKPLVSIIVVHFNTPDLLQKCLQSVFRYPPSDPFEVFVVDNGSSNGSPIMVKRSFPQIRLVANITNLGFAVANNLAFHEARGEYCLLLNSDTEVTPRAIDTLVEFLRSHGQAGIVGGKLLNPDGSVQPSCRPFPTFRRCLSSCRSPLGILFPKNRLTRRYLTPSGNYETIQKVDSVAAAFALIRKKTLNEVGVFDEQFFMFLEDTDLCFRMSRAGWEVYFDPESTVYHRWGGTASMMPYRMILEHNRSMWKFFCKHRHANPVSRAVLAAGFGANVLVSWTLRGLKSALRRPPRATTSPTA